MMTNFWRSCATVLLCVLPKTNDAQRPTGSPSHDVQVIRRLDGSRLDIDSADALARFTLTRHGVTGAQIAVVNDGRLVWSAAYGIRARGDSAALIGPRDDLPMQRTTTTWAASITKAVFATYVMQLVERGRFDLDTPVASQLQQPLDAYSAYREKGRVLVTDAKWQRVTPRMLLAHTSGLPNFAFLEPDGQLRLRGEPGARYRYSGEGINLVQFLVEQQLGQPLDSLMQAALFDSIGMTRTGMVFRPAFADDIADRFGAEGQFLSKTRRNPARAAGSMTSTAEDLAAFAIALLNGKVLQPATRATMLTPQVRITSSAQFGPGAEVDTGGGSDEARRAGLAYGLGWGLLTRTRYGPAFFKEGHGDGAQTYLLCFERRQTCVVILTNSDNGEFAFRALVEGLLGRVDVPWTWEGYTPAQIAEARKHQ